jgi:tRNA(Ile)-lysidine synthase
VTYKYTHINLTEGFISFIKGHQLIQPAESILLAVSGGVDSVVMSSLFYEAELPFAIAHCNFGLRGQESEEDEEFVRALAQQYKVKFYTTHFDTKAYAKANKLSTQMAARELRYTWFKELCNAYQINKLATAHHANDCLETILFNLTKGTSIAGLHGILPQQEKLIRPLLFASKESLLHYAQAKGLSWREDSSNIQDDYARNLIRHQVIPSLKLINPNLENTTNVTIDRLSQIEKLFNEQLESLRDELFSQQEDICYIAIQKIKQKTWAPVMLWEMLKPFGFNFLQIKSLLHPSVQTGKCIYTNDYQLYVDRTTWILSARKNSIMPSEHIVNEKIKDVNFLDQRLRLQVMLKEKYKITHNSQVAALDLEKLQFPLTIRPWQAGDFFYPLGMLQRKKISDFLIDQKVPLLLKQKVYVLESAGQIAWVIGYRIDDRFKVKEITKQVYELQLTLSN